MPATAEKTRHPVQARQRSSHRAPKGAAARARILAVFPRSCPRVQPYVQFLRPHERRGHCPGSERSRHRPSSDLEDGGERRTAHVALPFLPPSSPSLIGKAHV